MTPLDVTDAVLALVVIFAAADVWAWWRGRNHPGIPESCPVAYAARVQRVEVRR